MAKLSSAEALNLATRALAAAGANSEMARATAQALVDAEMQGQAGHGLSRVPQYVTFLKNGRADGAAVARVVRERGGACLIDAGDGLAYPAMALAISEATRRARANGVAFVAVRSSHHSGVSGRHAEALAREGLVAIMLTNSPAAIPAWGGKTPLYGTNPIAAAFPRRAGPPLVVDLSLSETARGKIAVAARDGKPIPLGWALDRDGKPTTDARAALEGSMLASGGSKGAALALVVELLCVALGGAAFGFEADSFFVDEGNRPRLGQAFLAIDPGAFAGSDVYLDRIETLLAAVLKDEGVRLPGDRRRGLQEKAARDGLEVADPLVAQIRKLAGA